MTEQLPVEFLLYHNGRRLAGGITTVAVSPNALGFAYLPGWMGGGGRQPQVELLCRGEALPGWISFDVTITDYDRVPMVSVGLPFMLFAQPAQFPSVLVMPSKDPQFPGALVLVARVAGPLSGPAGE